MELLNQSLAVSPALQADLPCHCQIAFPRLISNLLCGDSGGWEFVKATVVR